MRRLISLMYHNVVENGQAFPGLSPSVTSYFVERDVFRWQMQCASELSDCCTLDDVRAFHADSQPAPNNDRLPVHIGFDDGWLGTIDVAGPVLETVRFSATLFVTTDLVGRSGFVDRGTLQKLPPEFTIGSHARSHRLLNQLDDQEIREELRTSRRFLEDLTGHEIDTLSIPGGAYDTRVLRIAQEEGYRLIFTSDIRVHSQNDDPFSIGRIPITARTSQAGFRRYLSGDVCYERCKQELRRSVKRLIGTASYEWLRRILLGESKDQNDMVELTGS